MARARARRDDRFGHQLPLLAVDGVGSHGRAALALPSPRDYEDQDDGLRSLIRVLVDVLFGGSARRAEIGLGLGENVISAFLHGQHKSFTRRTLATIAGAVGWDVADLERLRPKQLARGAATVAARQANARVRGSWFRSTETYRSFVEKRGATGFGPRGYQRRVERYGPAGAIRGLRVAAARRQQPGPERDAYVERGRMLAALRQFDRHGDDRRKRLFRAEWRAWLRYRRNPQRRGRKNELAQQLELWKAAATAFHCGCSTAEISDMLGFRRGRDVYGNVMGGTWTREMIRRGEVLLGFSRQPKR